MNDTGPKPTKDWLLCPRDHRKRGPRAAGSSRGVEGRSGHPTMSPRLLPGRRSLRRGSSGLGVSPRRHRRSRFVRRTRHRFRPSGHRTPSPTHAVHDPLLLSAPHRFHFRDDRRRRDAGAGVAPVPRRSRRVSREVRRTLLRPVRTPRRRLAHRPSGAHARLGHDRTNHQRLRVRNFRTITANDTGT